MAQVREFIDISTAPALVWSVIGDPAAISRWHPGIASSPLADGVRHCTLASGERIAETIVAHSDERQFYVYAVGDGFFGMANYRSRIQVQAVNGGARVVWTGDFDAIEPDDADVLAESIAATYREGLEALRSAVTRNPQR